MIDVYMLFYYLIFIIHARALCVAHYPVTFVMIIFYVARPLHISHLLFLCLACQC